MPIWDKESLWAILCYSAVLGKGIPLNDERCVMATYPGKDKWIWLCTEMPQDVGIGISN